ncbi:unnamed protein product [Brassica oleracea var. botrytis]
MPELLTLAKLQSKHLHLMVHIHDVQYQRKNNLQRMRMARRKHVWNESHIEPKQPPLLLINQCLSIFQVRLNLFPFF